MRSGGDLPDPRSSTVISARHPEPLALNMPGPTFHRSVVSHVVVRFTLGVVTAPVLAELTR